ncbi:hypothetical protein V7S43_003997 [Phytophthora oleae]|uniref:Uncharacterized protein n=1 Tax=Phytophthora oleae TaxID=2107226 RepID=A0ABD3FYV1_9STRA
MPVFAPGVDCRLNGGVFRKPGETEDRHNSAQAAFAEPHESPLDDGALSRCACAYPLVARQGASAVYHGLRRRLRLEDRRDVCALLAPRIVFAQAPVAGSEPVDAVHVFLVIAMP